MVYTKFNETGDKIFYVDVGNLPKSKVEQYLHHAMNYYKNKGIRSTT